MYTRNPNRILVGARASSIGLLGTMRLRRASALGVVAHCTIATPIAQVHTPASNTAREAVTIAADSPHVLFGGIEGEICDTPNAL